MNRFGVGVLCGSLWGLAACSKSAPPAAGPEAAPAVAAEATAAPLTSVAKPAEVFALARVKNLATLADTAVAWSSMPVNWRTELAKEMPGLEQAVQLSAPVEFAAMLDPASTTEPR